ncbi:uncharacterized protein LOC120640361 [Panicum virgatum]|uniref:uncharacterized protein LOC120640361 n=1 Tax=Panicum virgatum TaxID=38727 RepID=UPI0019D5E65E|nr:uncharacterized protein LOC120640361 [Panicum virgatum]
MAATAGSGAHGRAARALERRRGQFGVGDPGKYRGVTHCSPAAPPRPLAAKPRDEPDPDDGRQRVVIFFGTQTGTARASPRRSLKGPRRGTTWPSSRYYIGCFELQGSLEGDLVLGRMEKTWYLEGPWKKTGCLSIQTDVITSGN